MKATRNAEIVCCARKGNGCVGHGDSTVLMPRAGVVLSPDTPGKVHGGFILEREGRVQDSESEVPRIGLTCTV